MSELHRRRADRQLVPVYVECKGCGKLVTARAQVNHSAGWNGSMGGLAFELLECPRGWELLEDQLGYAKSTGHCGDCCVKRPGSET